MKKGFLDYETRSELNLKEVGAVKYSLHPSTELISAHYKLPGETKVKNFKPLEGEKPPRELIEMLKSDTEIVAHNAFFEHCITNGVMKIYRQPRLWNCTANRCAAMALPRDLEGAAIALSLPVQKNMDGRKLILKYTKPRSAWTKWRDGGRQGKEPQKYFDKEMELLSIYDYGDTDVEVCELIDAHVPELIPFEKRLVTLNYLMNSRGVSVDLDLVRKVIKLNNQKVEQLQNEVAKLTGGEVTSVLQRDAVLTWLSKQGVVLSDLQIGTVENVLEGEVKGKSKRILEIRKLVSKTSVKKYQAIETREVKGRVGDLTLYHGASTGRESGRGVQVQNLPRGTIKNISQAIEVLKLSESYEDIDFFFDDYSEVYSSCLRSMFVSSPGKQLVVADLNAIECRVLNWLAGTKWVLKAFEDGHDLYKIGASKLYKKKIEDVTDSERFFAKTVELGCFAEDTKILTDSGYKKIIDVKITDKLWDGVQWVQHQGVLNQGIKKVIDLEGVEVTEEHLFMLPNHQWVRAVELKEKPDYLKSAKQKAMLPCKVMLLVFVVELLRLLSRARVNVNTFTLSKLQTFLMGKVKTVTTVLKNNLLKLIDIFTVTRLCYLTTNTESGFLTVFLLLNLDAKTQTTAGTTTMGAEELDFINHGVLITLLFCSTLLLLKTGITLAMRLIELIMTKDIRQGIYNLLAKNKTIKIKEQSKAYSQKLTDLKNVYDIVNAGPRNRFTIKTNDGHLIAHNCGYQMGAVKFYQTCVSYNVPNITEKIAADAVKFYRETHPTVTRLWSDYEAAAVKAVHEKTSIGIGHVIWGFRNKHLECVLPSGRSIYFPFATLRNEPTPWGEIRPKLYHYRIDSTTKKWVNRATYGGSLTESVCQAIARDVTMNGVVNVTSEGFEYLFQVHDEIVCESSSPDLEKFISAMVKKAPWFESLPVKASGYIAERYKK